MPAKLKKGDRVVVLTGKDRGKRGMVRTVINKTNRVVVEGVNMVTKHQRARSATQQSQLIQREAAIDVSNVMLIDPNTDEPTKVTFRQREDGSWVRVGKRNGEDIE
ncbi:MAG TPA: 50S ribosomal protein L24 [Dehalococcoidia bacterium]|nr:50S ribosomal protein L24 [Dehalococcoidia bacterium]